MAKETRNLLVNIIFEKQFKNIINQYADGCLIDIGCGEKPYKDLVAPFITEHIGIDYIDTMHDTKNIDIFATAYEIPVPNDSFDTAICTSVLEHLEEPEMALKECFRILKPGGYAIYSVPFIWHLHEDPRDFFRYSKYGLDYLFTKVGFKDIQIHALSGFWVTFGQLLVYNLYRLNRGFIRWIRIIDLIGLLIQGISYVLDKLDKTERWTYAYIIVAKK